MNLKTFVMHLTYSFTCTATALTDPDLYKAEITFTVAVLLCLSFFQSLLLANSFASGSVQFLIKMP